MTEKLLVHYKQSHDTVKQHVIERLKLGFMYITRPNICDRKTQNETNKAIGRKRNSVICTTRAVFAPHDDKVGNQCNLHLSNRKKKQSYFKELRIFIVQGGTLFNKLIQLDLILLNNFYLYIMWYIFLKIERNKEKSATGLCFEGLQGDVDAIGY